MIQLFGHRFSEEQMDVLKWIYRYRGITTRQLLAAKYPHQFPPSLESISAVSERSSIRKLVGKLIEKGLVSERSLPGQKDKLAFLTEDGLELVSTALEIPVGKVGTGYNGDYGDFRYELHSPPTTKVAHHLGLVNFFLMLEYVKSRHPELDIDYRDNRYVSEKYALAGDEEESKRSSRKFMPDGEILLNGKTYFVEIDMRTERARELSEKFNKYAEFFDYLTENGRPLPEGVLFISAAVERTGQFRRRWDKVVASYIREMGKWATRVNLIGGTIGDVAEIINFEVRDQKADVEELKKVLTYYIKGKGYKGTVFGEVNIPNLFSTNLSITQLGDKHQVFLYEPAPRYETKGIARVRAFQEWMSKANLPEFRQVEEVIPVFYHRNGEPVHLNFGEFEQRAEWEELFNRTFWLNVEGPHWADVEGKRINHSNPLISRVS